MAFTMWRGSALDAALDARRASPRLAEAALRSHGRTNIQPPYAVAPVSRPGLGLGPPAPVTHTHQQQLPQQQHALGAAQRAVAAGPAGGWQGNRPALLMPLTPTVSRASTAAGEVEGLVAQHLLDSLHGGGDVMQAALALAAGRVAVASRPVSAGHSRHASAAASPLAPGPAGPAHVQLRTAAAGPAAAAAWQAEAALGSGGHGSRAVGSYYSPSSGVPSPLTRGSSGSSSAVGYYASGQAGSLLAAHGSGAHTLTSLSSSAAGAAPARTTTNVRPPPPPPPPQLGQPLNLDLSFYGVGPRR